MKREDTEQQIGWCIFSIVTKFLKLQAEKSLKAVEITDKAADVKLHVSVVHCFGDYIELRLIFSVWIYGLLALVVKGNNGA